MYLQRAFTYIGHLHCVYIPGFIESICYILENYVEKEFTVWAEMLKMKN